MSNNLTGTTLILVRHAERVEPPPANNDPHLTPAGVSRAKALARILGQAGISAIYTSKFARTKETGKPLASRLGLLPKEVTAAIDLKNRIASDNTGQTVLVVGHTDTVPALINLLKENSAQEIADHEFDNMFVVTVLEAGKISVTKLKYGEPT